MGLLNKVWSGLDFWDKKENAKQRDQFKAQDEEEKRRKAAEAKARAQANANRQTNQPTQQVNVSVSDVPRKPTSTVTVANPNTQPSLQVYKPVITPEQKAREAASAAKIKELDAFKTARMARAIEEEKKNTSWFDRQFTDRKWDKRAEARAISGAAQDYQNKHGWNADSEVISYGRDARGKLDEAQKNATSQWVAPVISTGRVGTGIVQGMAGLYDLATPGKGTNRLSKAATKKAEEQDQLAKDMGIDKAYKTGNVAGEIASYAIPGVIAAKGAKAANATAKGASLIAKGASKVDDIAKMIDKGGDANKIRQFIAARVRQNFTVEEAIQELMITGRYMGQNTARGDDTNAQSIATDILMGIGGALLIPTKGINRLVNNGDDAAGAVADDVAGGTLGAGAEYLDNAITKGADVPPVKPDIEVPKGPPAVEVAPGVKSPNLATGTPEPPVIPNPSAVPTNPNVAPPVQPPTNVPPAQQPTPVQPPAPRVNEPPVYQQIEPPQKPVPMVEAPTPVQAVPETVPVTTPIKEASQEVIENSAPAVAPQRAPAPAPNPANTSDEALDVVRGQRESLLAERDARIAEGLPTVDLDRRIAQLDKAIAAKVAKPSKEATVLAEGDKQLQEATAPTKLNKKPEISKQEAPSKPKKETGVTTKELTPDEMAERGFTPEQIDAVMAYRAGKAPAEAPKVKETKKVDVAKSTTTPVKTTKTVAEPVATPTVKAEPEIPKSVDPNATLVELPKKPTQRQLNKAATENTIKSGKVSKKWINEQKAAGATDEQIAKAVEKVEGKKVEPTVEEKAQAEDRKKTNEEYKTKKAEAEAEGKTKEAAPKLVAEMAKQKAKELKKEVSYLKKHFSSFVKSFKIDEEMSKAHEIVDAKDETNIGQFVKDFLKKAEESDDPTDLFTGIALTKRLEELRRNGKLTDDGMLGLADEIYQSNAAKVSKSGQVQRIAQEIYKNVPAKVRVDKKLDTIKTQLGEYKIDFNPTDDQKLELVNLTDKFDTSATNLTGLDGEMTTNLDDFAAATTPEARAELFEKHKQLSKSYTEAQQATVDSSLAFNEAIKAMTPDLPKSVRAKEGILSIPDKIGNYLRMAMLSAPSGRIRDAFSTSLNILDDLPVQIGRALTGKVLNATTKGNYVDSVGSFGSLKKGIKGGMSKVKSSWKGEYTLDEATGRIGATDRSELLHKGKNSDPITSFGVKHSPKGSKWNLPKKLITTLVQGPTDATYAKYTEELFNLGKVEARSKGLSGKDAKMYAEMFMESPSKEAQQKAAQAWLSNSGMQNNVISTKLTKWADALDQAGNSKYKKDPVTGQKVKVSTTERAIVKTAARIFRTTTMPFVQYTGGSTHAMFMRQNPIANFGKFGKAATWGKDPQKAIDELSRGVWNTTKIGALAYALDKGWVETSDTDADGKTQYNGPYLVRTKPDGSKEYVPASTLGIAGGAAVIGGHYVNKFFKNMKEGNVTEALASITTEPTLATVKATGLNNMLSGSNIFGGVFANTERVANDPNKTGGDAASTIVAGLAGDIGSQAVPAASRDLNVIADQNKTLNPTGEKPDTSGKDPVTGKVNPWNKATAQITSGIPVLSQQLPRKSGELARGFEGRVLNANTQSDQQKASITADKNEKTTTVNRTADVVSDDKVAGLLSEETRAIYDKYKGDMSKASEQDSKKIWTEVTKAKDRLLDDGSYDSYSKILTYERDEGKAKGTSTETEVAEMDRKISRAKVASKRKTNPQIFRLYTGTDTPEGGGISQGEFKKMLQLDDDGNPEYPEVYDPDTATLLWELDQAMVEANASANANGVDPWTRNKYNLDEALGRGKYAKKGSGEKSKGVGTDFGSLAAYAKPASGSQAQKYQNVDGRSPLPNLTRQSSKTNLRKNISVVKGVRL